MSKPGSVTLWIARLRTDEEAALSQLYERYWPFLVRLARRRLSGPDRRVADEEDVAIQAFWGFYEKLRQGDIPRLRNRHDLYALLGIITARKAINQLKHGQRQKRGGGRVRGESAFEPPTDSDLHRGIDQRPGRTPSPEEEAILSDCYQHYVSALSEELRPIAERHLAGLSNLEISEAIGCSKRTIERKMRIILSNWKKTAAASLDEVLPEK